MTAKQELKMSGYRLILVVTMLLLISGCSAGLEYRPTEYPLEIPTETPTPDIAYMVTDIRTTGKVVLTEEINLSFAISGMVEELLVEEGDYVEENQVIGHLDTTVLDFELETAMSSLTVAQANLQRVKAGPSPYEIVEAENAVLAAELDTGSTPEEQAASVASAKAHLEYLRSLPLPEDLAIAEAGVAQALASVNLAKAYLAQAELIAPRDGAVVNVLINSHEYTRIGDPVVQIADLSQLSVEAEMYDFEIIHLKPGDSAVISFEALPGVAVEGIIKRIVPDETKPGGGRFIVTIRLSQAPAGLQRGMTAYVVIPR